MNSIKFSNEAKRRLIRDINNMTSCGLSFSQVMKELKDDMEIKKLEDGEYE